MPGLADLMFPPRVDVPLEPMLGPTQGLASRSPQGILSQALNQPLPMEGRLTFLPAMVNNGRREFALPGLLASAWNAFTAPGRAYSGNLENPEAEALNFAGMLQMGAMPSPAVGGPGTLGMNVYHGSPHVFDPEKLVQLPNGKQVFVGGRYNALQEVPAGGKVIKDFPLGRFRKEAINTGEGAQAYGYGSAYLAEEKSVAKGYRDVLTQTAPKGDDIGAAFNFVQKMGGDEKYAKEILSEQIKAMRFSGSPNLPTAEGMFKAIESGAYKSHNRPQGALYKVDLPDEQIAKMLDWDKPLSQQPKSVQRALMNLPTAHKLSPEMTGAQLYESTHLVGGPSADKKAAANALLKLGIPGIRYLDGGSRAGGKGTSNFVVFDDSIPKIIGRE